MPIQRKLMTTLLQIFLTGSLLFLKACREAPQEEQGSSLQLKHSVFANYQKTTANYIIYSASRCFPPLSSVTEQCFPSTVGSESLEWAGVPRTSSQFPWWLLASLIWAFYSHSWKTGSTHVGPDPQRRQIRRKQWHFTWRHGGNLTLVSTKVKVRSRSHHWYAAQQPVGRRLSATGFPGSKFVPNVKTCVVGCVHGTIPTSWVRVPSGLGSRIIHSSDNAGLCFLLSSSITAAWKTGNVSCDINRYWWHIITSLLCDVVS